jgi:dCTP deaminase
MSILCDQEIIDLVHGMVDRGERPMIAPFQTSSVRKIQEAHGKSERRLISFGVTSYGYDVTLGKEVKIFTNIHGGIVDPKRFDADKVLMDAPVQKDEDGSDYVLLPPNSYLLGVTNEYFCMPRDIVALCVGKSTYARACAIVNVTPIEPGFEGNVVIEVANGSSLSVKIYLNEGIAQFMFLRGKPCKVSYKDRDGKYQGQTGVTLPRV